MLSRLYLLAVAVILPLSSPGASGQEALDGVTFRQNSKVMYEKIVDAVPSPFRGRTRAKWEREIAETCGDGGVTEEDVVEIAKRLTPRLFLRSTLEIADEHRTEQ
mmetsp:Transcript_3849/g.8642  ORF Transcript_3849/g.8642 Transcript_3849/m.8642 type:complete len:105 (+) Transcript_3849:82-396(+)